MIMKASSDRQVGAGLLGFHMQVQKRLVHRGRLKMTRSRQLRAHCAEFDHDAPRWGIAGVSTRGGMVSCNISITAICACAWQYLHMS